MTRREWLRAAGLLAGALAWEAPISKLLAAPLPDEPLRRAQFGPDFLWGVATSAYQIEGAWRADGKGPSIWDTFTHTQGNVKDGSTGDVACDFYHRYRQDIQLMRELAIPNFRFSIAWPRIFPNGSGPANTAGLDFYDRVIDRCLEQGIEPWVTLYHWDLPQALQDQGGWANRDIIGWFGDYAATCARRFGDRVQYWMVFNEPPSFVYLGYLLGLHAPGLKRVGDFFAATHHVTLCQAEGGRVLREQLPAPAQIGTTFSCSDAQPIDPSAERHVRAAARLDALLNRLFIEPTLGKGYPTDTVGFLKRLHKYHQADDEQRLPFDFDFIGLQNYFRVVVKHSLLRPFVWANRIQPAALVEDEKELTTMGWEPYPPGIYKMLKQFGAYEGVRKIYVTENGAAFEDHVTPAGRIHDERRKRFIQNYLAQVLRARQEGVPVQGYLIWTFMDNFEWAEGYEPRFGIVHVDFSTQQRRPKDSALWFRDFLQEGQG